jgi:hypothetical protein
MMVTGRRLTTLAGIAVIPAVLGAAGAMALEPIAYMCPGDAIGTPYEIRDYTISYPTDGVRFVFYEGTETATGAAVDVLEDCETKEQLLTRVHYGTATEAADLDAASVFSTLVFGEEPMTMAQMADVLRRVGGEPEFRRVNYVSCACATGGY